MLSTALLGAAALAFGADPYVPVLVHDADERSLAGDWELVQVRLDRRGRPVEIVTAQHAGAERCAWAEVRRRDGHPVVFVAEGSHAAYLRPVVRDRTAPDPNDEADGRARRPWAGPSGSAAARRARSPARRRA